jgi:hypothetical protein
MTTATISIHPSSRSHRLISLLGTTAVALLALCLAYIVVVWIFYGADMRAAAERQKTAIVAAENLTFCNKLGLNAGTGAFSICAEGLAEIRRLHEERVNAQFNFL